MIGSYLTTIQRWVSEKSIFMLEELFYSCKYIFFVRIDYLDGSVINHFNFFVNHYRPFPLFLLNLSLWQCFLFSWSASIVGDNNLKRAAELVMWFPDMTSVWTHLTLRKIAIWLSKNCQKMSSFWQFFDSQMAIFRRVRDTPFAPTKITL